MTFALDKWQGSAAILPGVGVFIGHSGNNAEHKHWAHQVSITLATDLVISSGQRSIIGRALFVPANTAHALQPSTTLSMFVDPTTLLAKVLTDAISASSKICEIPYELAQSIINCFDNTDALQAGVMRLQHSLCTASNAASDSRKTIVLEKLHTILHGNVVTRNELAMLTCLSPSRFSHWFKEETGMPLRSYRKWLHLISGIEAILNG